MNKSFTLSDPTSCLNKAHHDEPLFVLRANDPTAPMTIRHWVTMNHNHQPPGKLEQAMIVAEDMETWYSKQPKPVEPEPKRVSDMTAKMEAAAGVARSTRIY